MLHALSAYSFTRRKEISEYLQMSSSGSKLWTVDSPVGVTVLENKMGSRLIETYCHPQKNIKPKHATSSVQCSFTCHFLNKIFKPKTLYKPQQISLFQKDFWYLADIILSVRIQGFASHCFHTEFQNFSHSYIPIPPDLQLEICCSVP
jgi:hypothetical protein